MKRSAQIVLTLSILLTVAGAAWAQETALVTLRSEVLREVEIVNEKGDKEIQLVPVVDAMPGDVLVFRVTYTNEGTESAQNVQLTNPVPEQMVYEADSAGGEGTVITFSVDGGKAFAGPEALTVTGEDGRKKQAAPADYTHIRWQLEKPVPQGAEGSVSFKARLK
jgi:uncharacterized repeat protein (TIGR01451 family)